MRKRRTEKSDILNRSLGFLICPISFRVVFALASLSCRFDLQKQSSIDTTGSSHQKLSQVTRGSRLPPQNNTDHSRHRLSSNNSTLYPTSDMTGKLDIATTAQRLQTQSSVNTKLITKQKQREQYMPLKSSLLKDFRAAQSDIGR